MSHFPNVTICGCGSGGLAMAADLAMLGCRVNLYEVPALKANLDPIRAQGGICLTGMPCYGKTGLAPLRLVTDDAEEALAGSELVFINVPTMAVGTFLEHLAPHLSEGQVVVVTTCYFASFRHRELLRRTGAFDKYVFAEMSIMPYLSGKTGPAAVHVNNYKRELYVAAWPARGNALLMEKMQRTYPQTRLCKHVLEVNFRPFNPGTHPQMTIPKAAFFFEQARVFHFYGEVSMCGSRLVDAHDAERLKLAAAYDCETITQPEFIRRVYLYEGKNMYELHGSRAREQKWNPIEELEQLLIEDICYWLVPSEGLAQVVGLDLPVTRAVTDILAPMTGYDYRANALSLKDLGLDGMTREQIIEFSVTGRAKTAAR